MFSPVDVTPVLGWVMPRLEKLDGRLDGRLARGAAITVPIGAAFQTIEALFAEAVKKFPNIEWYFANVYDDAGKPLNWWLEK